MPICGTHLPLFAQAEKMGSISVCRFAHIYKQRVSETRTHGLHVVFFAALSSAQVNNSWGPQF